MTTSRVRTSRSPWLVALAGIGLPLGPTLALVMFGPSCDPSSDAPAPLTAELQPFEAAAEVASEADTDAASPDAAEGAEDLDDEADPAELEEPAEPPAPARPAAIGIRGAGRTTIAYAAPRYGSDMRGRIDTGGTFEIFELVEGTDCTEGGWARVDHDSYVCLKHAVADDRPPVMQPVIPEGLIVPFIYAKPKADRRGNLLAEVPRYKSRSALVMGREPLEILDANHQYAFVEQVHVPGHGKVLFDPDEQAVPVEGLRFDKPSEFFGRELAVTPIPAGLAAAWAISREAVLRRKPSLKAKVEGQLEYHQPLDVNPESQRGGGSTWIEIPGGFDDGDSAYVEANKVRVWTDGLPLDDIPDDETWIDVDIGQQLLALVRGQEPVFITLISSGTGHKPNTATPRGVYRIRNKVAHGPMRNRPEDAEESPYHVEAVPWVQYFHRRFALHGAYWHNGFGHRKSHGCVNLAPRDARYVFERTGPNLPPGWMTVYEHADQPGSVVRVRKGAEAVPDRRTDVEPAEDPLLAVAGDP